MTHDYVEFSMGQVQPAAAAAAVPVDASWRSCPAAGHVRSAGHTVSAAEEPGRGLTG